MSAATTAARREELHRRGVRPEIFTILLSAYVAYEAVGVLLARGGPDREGSAFLRYLVPLRLAKGTSHHGARRERHHPHRAYRPR